MKRRKLIYLGLGGVALTVGYGYLSGVNPSTKTFSSSENSLPSIKSDSLFQFAVIGDVGTGRRGQHSVARAMHQHWKSSPFSMSLMTGDNIYPNGEIEKVSQVFEQPYSALLEKGVKFYASLGNHDVRTNRGEDQITYPGYNMASRYYTFTQSLGESTIQFFAIDTNQAYLEGEEGERRWQAQLAWLQSELGSSSAPWKIVFGHHPVYSSGYHGSQDRLIRDLSPIFAQHGVQLYLNGHDHNYERTQPIKRTTYITTGHGAMNRRIGQSDWTALISNQLGFTTFSVHPDRIVAKAINTQNKVYDEGHILLTV